MDVITYLSILALAILLLTIYLARKKKLGRNLRDTQTSQVTQDAQRKHETANKVSQSSTLTKESQAPARTTQRAASLVDPASTLRTDQVENNTLMMNRSTSTNQSSSPSFATSSFASSPTPSSTPSAVNNSEVLLLLPTEADNSLNTRNAFKSPPGNLKIFSLYSDFVNEVSDDVQNVTDSFLHGINTLIDSDYHLVHDDEWRRVMEQNARLAQMTSRYVKRYRYPHYAGHIHQMLVTCLTTVTHATDLIDESFANAIEGETDQAKSKLRNSQVLLNKSPKYLEYCNSAMGACYLELSQHI